jgi:phospholipid transport system substrate-binding protein
MECLMTKNFRPLLVMVFFILASSTSMLAFAKSAQPTDGEAFISDLTAKVLAISADKTKSEALKEAALVKIMDSTLDVERIGRFVLGTHWRSATQLQRERYSKAYHRYLVETYIPKLLRNNSAKTSIKRVVIDSPSDQTVETEVNSDGEIYIQVDYKIRKTAPKNEFKIIDVVAEGISLSSTQRADFASIIDQEGLDAFITRLEIKASRAP